MVLSLLFFTGVGINAYMANPNGIAPPHSEIQRDFVNDPAVNNP